MPRGFVTRIKFLASIALLLAIPTIHGQQAAPAQAAPQAYSAPDMTVGLVPGDVLDTYYLDFPEAGTIHLTVSPAGTIFVPYVGLVKIEGLMPDQAEQAIVDALISKQVVKSPHVSVNVVTARNLSAMVIGAVTIPHPVPVFGPTPLSVVMAQAGPLLPTASYHVLVAHRDGSPPADVELDRTGLSMRGMNVMVNPGDVVSVVTAGSFFALGEFIHPGIYPIVGTQHMTLMQALAVAGGPDIYASLSKSRILRIVDGHREEIIVDLAKLHEGKIADPLIQTDDVVFLPRSNGKVIMNSWLNQSLYALTAVNVVKEY
jgi:polysaccharide biosynthesis/export protein